MDANVSRKVQLRLAAALIGAACAGSAAAQELDTSDLARPQVRAASCAEVDWERQLLLEYPRIAEGCQEVVLADGRKWARFAASFMRMQPDGSVTVDFKDRAGASLAELTLQPAAGQRVSIDGRSYQFSDLRRGQELSVYVPERIFAAAIEPGALPEQLVPIVPNAVRREQVDAAPQLGPAQPLAAATRLPDTAGPLPWLAAGGLASMLGGLGLMIGRRARR